MPAVEINGVDFSDFMLKMSILSKPAENEQYDICKYFLLVKKIILRIYNSIIVKYC